MSLGKDFVIRNRDVVFANLAQFDQSYVASTLTRSFISQRV